MSKYKVLHPVALGGRRERGDVVDISDKEAPSFVKAGLVEEYKGEKPASNEPAEKALEDMSAEELKAKAKELSLPQSGSKADLAERIQLHLDGPQDEDADEEDADAEGSAPAPTADDAPDAGDSDDADADDSDSEGDDDAGDESPADSDDEDKE